MKRTIGILLCGVLLFALPGQAAAQSAELSGGDFQYEVTAENTARILRYTGSQAEPDIPGMLGTYPVTKIGEAAFRDCGFLVKAMLPESIEVIGAQAFYNCTALTDILLPLSLREIGDLAFSYCTALEVISIPPGSVSIGEFAFSDCAALRQAVIPDSVSAIGPDAFAGSSSELTISCSAGSFAYNYAVANSIAFGDPANSSEGQAPQAAYLDDDPGSGPQTIEPDRTENDAPASPWPADIAAAYDLVAVNKGDKRAMAYCGPGKEYREAGAFKTNKLTRVKGIFTEGNYVLADLDYTGVGKRRVYFRKSAFKNSDSVPSWDLAGVDAITLAGLKMYFGPGGEYDDFDGEGLPAGSQIRVFFEERGWVFAEFMTSQGMVRAWVEAGAVQAANK